MSGFRPSQDRQRISPRRVEALLREEFSPQIDAQRDKVPGWRDVEVMARLHRPSRRASRSRQVR